MSAYVVNEKTINVVVSYAVKMNMIHKDLAPSVAKLLLIENCKSVDSRYGSENEMTEETQVQYKYKEESANDLQVYGCARCLNYQSCEHGSYEDSYAFALIEEISELLKEKVQGIDNMDYPWGARD